MATGIVLDSKQEAMECLYAIEALARLLQKAHEHTSDAQTGAYVTAFVIERNSQRLMAMLGEG